MATVLIDYHVGYTQILLCQQSFNEGIHGYVCEHHKINAREIFINLEKKNIFDVRVHFAQKVFKKEEEKRSSYNLSNIVLNQKYFIDGKLKSGKCFFITVLIFTI